MKSAADVARVAQLMVEQRWVDDALGLHLLALLFHSCPTALDTLLLKKLKHLPRDALLSTAHLWSNVRSIDASGTRADDEFLRKLGESNAARSSLTELILKDCAAITDDGLCHLAAFPHLRTLSLAGCPLITSACAEILDRAVPQLESLDLDRLHSVTDEFLDALLPQYGPPSIEDMVYILRGLQPPATRRADVPQALPNLRRLSLYDTHLHSLSLENFLEERRNLEKLTLLQLPDYPGGWYDQEGLKNRLVLLAAAVCPNLERPACKWFYLPHIRKEAQMSDEPFDPTTWLRAVLPPAVRHLPLDVWEEKGTDELRAFFDGVADHLTLSLKTSKVKPSDADKSGGGDDDVGSRPCHVTMTALRVRDSQRVTFDSVWRSAALPWCAATREALTRLELCRVSMGLEAFVQLRTFANLSRLDVVSVELLVASEPGDDHHSAAVSDTINALGRLRRLAFKRNCVLYPAAAAELDLKPWRSPAGRPREATAADHRRRVRLHLRHASLRRLEVSWEPGWSVDLPPLLVAADCPRLERFVGEQAWVCQHLADLPTWWPRLERLTVIRPKERPDQAQSTAMTAPEALLDLAELEPAVRRWPRLRELERGRSRGEVVSIRDHDVPTQQLPPGWTTAFERLTRLSLTKSAVGSEQLAELVRACTRLHELEVVACPNVTTVSALASTSLATLRLGLESLDSATLQLEGFPNLVELYVDTRESLVDVLFVSGMAWLSDLSVSGRLKQLRIVDNPLLATLSLFRCPELRGVELVAPHLKSFEVHDCWRLRRLDGRFERPTLVNVALFSTSLAGDDVARLCPSASEFQEHEDEAKWYGCPRDLTDDEEEGSGDEEDEVDDHVSLDA